MTDMRVLQKAFSFSCLIELRITMQQMNLNSRFSSRNSVLPTTLPYFPNQPRNQTFIDPTLYVSNMCVCLYVYACLSVYMHVCS